MSKETEGQGLTEDAAEDTVVDEVEVSVEAEADAEDGAGSPDGEDIDFAALVAEAEAEAEADTEAEEPDEAGPEEEGELADDEESGDDDLDDEAPVEREEDPAPEEEKRPEGRELAELRELVKVQQAQIASLVDVLREGKERPNEEKPKGRAPEADLTDDDLKAALFGSLDDLKNMGEERRSKALQAARRRMDEEVRYFRDPTARYTEQLREMVLKDVFTAIHPVLEDLNERKVQQLVRENLDPIKDPTVKERAKEIYLESAGSSAPRWSDRQKTMALAVKAARLEAVERARDQKRQKKRARKVQAQASGGGKLRGTARQGKGARPKDQFPDLKLGQSLSEYAEELREKFADA